MVLARSRQGNVANIFNPCMASAPIVIRIRESVIRIHVSETAIRTVVRITADPEERNPLAHRHHVSVVDLTTDAGFQFPKNSKNEFQHIWDGRHVPFDVPKAFPCVP
jgi:hypothetical protein